MKMTTSCLLVISLAGMVSLAASFNVTESLHDFFDIFKVHQRTINAPSEELEFL